MFERFRWRVPAAIAVALLCLGALPVAADLSTHSPSPVAGLADGSTPTVILTVRSGPAIAGWVSTTAGAALPPAGNSVPGSASGRVWLLPPMPSVSIATNVTDFDGSITPAVAAKMAHDVVLDLIIESEARRSHDLKLAQSGASADGLAEFDGVTKQDVAAGTFVEKTYSFSQIKIQLFLPKFATQAARLVGVTVLGTATITTRNAAGNVISKANAPYNKTWGLFGSPGDSYDPIGVDYTGLAPAP
jgi:hypothetical protein